MQNNDNSPKANERSMKEACIVGDDGLNTTRDNPFLLATVCLRSIAHPEMAKGALPKVAVSSGCRIAVWRFCLHPVSSRITVAVIIVIEC